MSGVREIPRLRVSSIYRDLDQSLEHLDLHRERVVRSRAAVDRAETSPDPHYGINTGFGVLAQVRIPPEQLALLQRNILLSHAVGVGDTIPLELSSLMLQLKIHSLGLGFSGVSPECFDGLCRLWQFSLIPAVPEKGSVGASGDLAPLAHLALPLIGGGAIWDAGRVRPTSELIAAGRFEPISLRPKDGLALINGTQFMLAYGVWCLHHAERLLKSADVIAAMTLESIRGSITPFDPRFHAVRPHPGHGEVSRNVRRMMEKSEILESHRNCGRVQDPYSIRCIPQVHGASRDALRYASGAIEVELNSATDNPLVFDDGTIASGGNFHGQPLAIALDTAAMALAEIASISERRIYLLLTGHDSLPRLLMSDTGVNSGFMIPQYTAAALVSENKVLAHPACVDSIPTCLGQEDHVSMGSISATKLKRILHNTLQVLAIELLCTSQALDYRRPLKPGRGVSVAHRCVRDIVSHHEEDWFLRGALDACANLVWDGPLLQAVEDEIGGALE